MRNSVLFVNIIYGYRGGKNMGFVWQNSINGYMQGKQDNEYREPKMLDTYALRVNAQFRLPVNEKIYWVPVNVLGSPNLTNDEIKNLDRNPKELKANINTLSDLIRYIQLNMMRPESGNPYRIENGIKWEFSRSIEQIVKNNGANCRDLVEFSNYILEDIYQEVGIIHWCRVDGGHVFNYIKNNDKYFIFDLTGYMNSWPHISKELGNEDSYYRSNNDFIKNLHEADSIDDYFSYFLERCCRTKPCVLLTYASKKVLRTGSRKEWNRRRYFFPNRDFSQYNSDEHIVIEIAEPSECIPEHE